MYSIVSALQLERNNSLQMQPGISAGGCSGRDITAWAIRQEYIHVYIKCIEPWMSCTRAGAGRKLQGWIMTPSCSRLWEWAMSISAGSKIRNLGELCYLDNKSLGVLEGSFFIGKHQWNECFAAYLFIAYQCCFALHFLEKAWCLNGLKGGCCERTKPPL